MVRSQAMPWRSPPEDLHAAQQKVTSAGVKCCGTGLECRLKAHDGEAQAEPGWRGVSRDLNDTRRQPRHRHASTATAAANAPAMRRKPKRGFPPSLVVRALLLGAAGCAIR